MAARMIADTRNTKAARARRKQGRAVTAISVDRDYLVATFDRRADDRWYAPSDLTDWMVSIANPVMGHSLRYTPGRAT